MQAPHHDSVPQLTPAQLAEQQLEAERVQEVLFLLKSLLTREQTTVKAILSCLLDVGVVHFINDRVQIRPLRPLARPLAKASKPVLMFAAHRWVQQKCPALVANWLHRKILQTAQRKKRSPSSVPLATATVVVEPTVLYQREIRRLRSRVQLTTGALVGVSSILVLALVGVDFKSAPFWQSTVTGSVTAPDLGKNP